MKTSEEWTDYSKLKTIRIGIVGATASVLTSAAMPGRYWRRCSKKRSPRAKSSWSTIEGLLPSRIVPRCSKPSRTTVLAQLKTCHVVLKGPTTTPKKGDPWPNIESANVAMRRELDLFANVRPVRVPEQGIDWMFFRENTEGSYVLGSKAST